MTRPSFHQVIVGAGANDAITSMARQLRVQLQALGESHIYAHYLDPAEAPDVRPLRDLPNARSGDLLVYHASFGEPEVSRILLTRTEPLIVVYHNVTPPEHFVRHDPRFAAGLLWGRYELEQLRSRVVLAVAVSEFNRRDLEQLGYDDVHVIPAGLHPARLVQLLPDPELATDLATRFPDGYLLAVSQLLPHKCFEDLIAAMHLLRWTHLRRLGLVIAGVPRSPAYADALHRYAIRLNLDGVWFTGALADHQLATLFRRASLFASASRHEGLALPPLEAMSFGVPVVARAAGAIEETLGGAGLLLPADAGPALIAEAADLVLGDVDLAAELRRRGANRVADFERAAPSAAFAGLVAAVMA